MNALPVETQIKILENIDWDIMILSHGGLCYSIGLSIYQNCPQHSECDNISKIIPLFRRYNAQQFGADMYNDYWWNKDEEGYELRRQFVQWIIDELKKEIQQ